MNKCKWFGCNFSKWEIQPRPSYKGLKSVIIEQHRKCKRCGKTEIEYS